ncbi:hypothetical protein [Aureimonas psammosilenae]|uniref:hypothetical protein n=1 Tax=Aureimonas psammosilenae TaxID=2495496 RepID=UPI0012604A6C|nr:hypothetical protein [Aureimonas psammosilenae]
MTWTKEKAIEALLDAKERIDTGEPWMKVPEAVQARSNVDDTVAAIRGGVPYAFEMASHAFVIAGHWVPMEEEPALLEKARGVAEAVRNGDLPGKGL